MSRTAYLNVEVATPTQQWATLRRLADMAAELEATGDFTFITVGSTHMDNDSDEEPEEHLRYDDQTMRKVREAINESLKIYTIMDRESRITDIITNLQNAGILFRERA